MRLAALRRHRYSIPLTRPWQDARGIVTLREGWLVCIETKDGLRGWGEAACLPALGTGTARDIEMMLAWAAETLVGLSPGEALSRLDIGEAAQRLASAPASRCALEFALLDLQARGAGVPLYRWLRAEAKSSVAVNASIGGLDVDTGDRLAAAAQAGFPVAKLKLGLAAAAEEWPMLQRLLASRPRDCALRLDVNGAWSMPVAERLLPELCGQGIEALEEPCAAADDATLARWQAGLDYSLAVDESLPGRDEAVPLPVHRQVLKPMLLGGPRRAMVLAARPGISSVVSSTLETATGLWACAHLAAAVSAPGAPRLAHGLDTGGWLTRLLGPELPAGGRIMLGESPGLGFEPVLS